MQVHDCYLVVETTDGITVIDQHALHERIMYERLRVLGREYAAARGKLMHYERVLGWIGDKLAEAEEERRRVAYQSGRLAELFGQVLDVIGGRRRNPDVDQRDDQ